MKRGGGGEARTGKATEPGRTPRKTKKKNAAHAPGRCGAPGRGPLGPPGPGPGRHGGRPLAVTPSVHLRPRAGNPEKPPGGLFRVACRRAGPDGARTAAVGGPSSRAVRGLRPVRGQTNETFRRRNEKHPRRVKKKQKPQPPPTPETGKTKNRPAAGRRLGGGCRRRPSAAPATGGPGEPRHPDAPGKSFAPPAIGTAAPPLL